MSDDREPVECCKCHQSMSLDDGCEWGDFERLYCWGCAHDEIYRLRAIVDRLPKTADGVPIAPGDTLYDRYRALAFNITGFNTRDGMLSCLYGAGGFDAICSGYYSTREDAEKARNP